MTLEFHYQVKAVRGGSTEEQGVCNEFQGSFSGCPHLRLSGGNILQPLWESSWDNQRISEGRDRKTQRVEADHLVGGFCPVIRSEIFYKLGRIFEQFKRKGMVIAVRKFIPVYPNHPGRGRTCCSGGQLPGADRNRARGGYTSF